MEIIDLQAELENQAKLAVPRRRLFVFRSASFNEEKLAALQLKSTT